MPERLRQLHMDITRAGEKKENKVTKASKAQAAKYKDQETASRREPISRRLPRALQPDSETHPVMGESPRGFFEVQEGTCPNAEGRSCC